ncbi:uncharacterized protein TRIVIDRAFT_221193 [Trichoderma virens Gv29-8]|uniref:Uncharacterized protein n=1 Tax=Hypocrea virens (strain Gv29-8 / FGSC 10586) TaxID=413071 RepID=G9MPZ6_HYPVG|nr:uncharacterized protein TRIVIDRAFT_221193 [Trichoderma virens Gv29-8]EHK23945.1 hypothetical protein TRIVIDRAFT_221193 [Trichoderma virens Gv29-8]UKZ50252.1 hypothetical protein TrVGV298_004509 [Trichoderma virens]UKZ76695.1 hypothetical protein TrVFT333_004404 [Trichoderma virens FT-333]
MAWGTPYWHIYPTRIFKHLNGGGTPSDVPGAQGWLDSECWDKEEGSALWPGLYRDSFDTDTSYKAARAHFQARNGRACSPQRTRLYRYAQR